MDRYGNMLLFHGLIIAATTVIHKNVTSIASRIQPVSAGIGTTSGAAVLRVLRRGI